jgi:hypothetical protein
MQPIAQSLYQLCYPSFVNEVLLNQINELVLGGTMLFINSGTEFFSVSVYNDQVTVAWKFDVMPLGQVYRFHKDEPDGNWTTVLIRMDNNGIMGKFSFASEDTTQSFSASVFPLESWQKLITSSKIMLGGRAGVQDNIGELPYMDGV